MDYITYIPLLYAKLTNRMAFYGYVKDQSFSKEEFGQFFQNSPLHTSWLIEPFACFAQFGPYAIKSIADNIYDKQKITRHMVQIARLLR